MTNAGLVKDQAKTQKPQPLYGMHSLRHAAVSLWTETGAPPKKVMTWAGHASIQFTMDAYGHLWEDKTGDDAITQLMENSVFAST